MITLKRFRRIEAALRVAGYGPVIEWSESIQPPADADAFTEQAIYVICNSGMRNTVAVPIFERCMHALRTGKSVKRAFGHPGKSAAIRWIWKRREALFEQYRTTDDVLEFLQELPWIGPVTSYHLAKNLGVDAAKPDVHLERLAAWEGTDTHRMCARLSRQSGYRIATVDSILWQACADGIIDSKAYRKEGWVAGWRG
jgi:hypothetical protein